MITMNIKKNKLIESLILYHTEQLRRENLSLQVRQEIEEKIASLNFCDSIECISSALVDVDFTMKLYVDMPIHNKLNIRKGDYLIPYDMIRYGTYTIASKPIGRGSILCLADHLAEMCPFCKWLTDVGYGDRPTIATDVADLLL
jgi:hypothetical protein